MCCSSHGRSHSTPEEPEEVGHGEHEAYHHQDHPLQFEGEEGREEEADPDDREDDETGPEYLDLSSAELDVLVLLTGLEPPDRLPLLVDIVPPAQPSHDPPRDVLDSPEVHGEKQDNGNKAADEIIGEPATEEIC